MTDSKQARTLLKSLSTDGIEEIYLEPRRAPAPKPTSTAAPGPAKLPPSLASGNSREALLKLKEKTLTCTLCDELSATRKQVVFGSGHTRPQLVFVGDAPGAEDDEQGLPFAGAAGELFTKIIESIGLTREQVFITHALKCRPPANRHPKPEEIKNCEPYLQKQLELLSPKIVCALGTFAAHTLLKTMAPLSELRGQFFRQGNYQLICTYHPAHLLLNPGDKRMVWEDMKTIKRELESLHA